MPIQNKHLYLYQQKQTTMKTQTELKQMSLKQLRLVLKDMGLNKLHEGINTHNPAHYYDTINFILQNQ